MTEQIKAGDLAMIVRPTRCCGKGKLGRIGKVQSVSVGQGYCHYCGFEASQLDVQWESGWFTSAYRVKRVPPLDELDGVKHEEDLREPA
jgi:hypothetical protein